MIWSPLPIVANPQDLSAACAIDTGLILRGLACSNSCSNPACKWPQKEPLPWREAAISTGIDRFWTRVLRVRDREAPGSNPGPPTIFVFEIDDFQCGLESAAHLRITISCRATKPGRCNGVCRGECEITRLGIVG